VGVKEIVAVGVVVIVGVGGTSVVVAVAVAVGVACPNRLAEPAIKKTTENTRTLNGVIRNIIDRTLLLEKTTRSIPFYDPQETGYTLLEDWHSTTKALFRKDFPVLL
jgi:hypothetical protein